MKKLMYLFSFICLLSFQSKADSPLTSTEFHLAYKQESIIKHTIAANGKMDIRMIDYVMNPKNPIGTKLALVNALGWSTEGRDNAGYLWDKYLSNIYKNKNNFLKKGKGDELIIFAYLKSMDNYFNVDEALLYANEAVEKNKKSYAIAIVHSLIKAQSIFSKDWCEVYYVSHIVAENRSLKNDLLDAASVIIFDYMDLYKEYCK